MRKLHLFIYFEYRQNFSGTYTEFSDVEVYRTSYYYNDASFHKCVLNKNCI